MMEMHVKSIFSYFPELSSQQKEQFIALKGLYEEWNEKINVISRKDIGELYLRHVLHSLSIAKVIEFKEGSSILDIGTGGGFPGIPLAILFPEVDFTLVDSIGKKIKVVQEIATALGLKNVWAYHSRAEKIPGKFDFVLSRAVAPTAEILRWANGKFNSSSKNKLTNGFLLLKGGDLKDELKQAKRPYREFIISDFFQEEFFKTKKIIYLPASGKK